MSRRGCRQSFNGTIEFNIFEREVLGSPVKELDVEEREKDDVSGEATAGVSASARRLKGRECARPTTSQRRSDQESDRQDLADRLTNI